ncbi:MAG: hypothetical protein ABSA80_10210 [Terriglobales bacterium]|jgi:hypothetical protein
MDRRLSKFDQRRIAATLPLRKGVEIDGVLAEVEAATQRFWRDYEPEARIQGAEVKGRTLRLTLKRHSSKVGASGRVTSAGAPPKKALRGYVASLVAIYERATGRRITRVVDAYADGHREKRHPFLAACMKAAGKGYPAGLVRQVLDEL